MKNILPEFGAAFKKIIDPSSYRYISSEFRGFLSFLNIYAKDKIIIASNAFETTKGALVKNVLIKRGKKNRMFLHVSAMIMLTVGVVVSPFISDANLFGQNDNLSFAQSAGPEDSITTVDVFATSESEKPRDKIIKYTVQNGDTLSTVAQKFGISQETIKWANDLRSNTLTVGQELEILPVAGIAHKVERGDSVYTIAKKYSAEAQAIVDFPFNDFANPQTFSIVEGQILIVPEGVKPEEAPKLVRPRFIATGPVTITGEGFTWPIRGTINQGYVWYHKAIDIGSSVGSPVVAAHSGRVSEVYNGGYNGGYGIHVIISGDNGYVTLYAHMSGTNVSPGDTVLAGRTLIGWVGLTGRTTGSHLHFEIRGAQGFLNPLGIMQ